MAKLYFFKGTMNSSKSTSAISAADNYLEIKARPLLVKPKRQNTEKIIETKSGIFADCIYMEELILMQDIDIKGYDAIIVDDAHFISPSDGAFLSHIVDVVDVPVMCYGLSTDYKGKLFEGSAWLFANADSTSEIKTICAVCKKHALYTALVDKKSKKILRKNVFKDHTNEYISLCRKDFNKTILNLPKDYF